MTILGQFVLVQNRQNWEQACAELAKEIARQRNATTVSIDFPKQPATYPCLMAVVPVPTDITLVGNIDQTKVLTSFVYPADALRLIEAYQSANPDLNPPVVADAALDTNYSDSATEAAYVPSPVAVLLLALVHELKAVGALQKDKLLTAVKDAEAWLDRMQEVNENAPMQAILRRFWEAF